MTDMTEAELNDASNRLRAALDGLALDAAMAALGILVVECLRQIPDENDFQVATSSWMTTLIKALAKSRKDQRLH